MMNSINEYPKLLLQNAFKSLFHIPPFLDCYTYIENLPDLFSHWIYWSTICVGEARSSASDVRSAEDKVSIAPAADIAEFSVGSTNLVLEPLTDFQRVLQLNTFMSVNEARNQY